MIAHQDNEFAILGPPTLGRESIFFARGGLLNSNKWLRVGYGSGRYATNSDYYTNFRFASGGPRDGRFQYTGQKWIGEAGLYDYKARDYLPHLGIFAQTDPIEYEDSANLYAYVLNDPVNLIDPLGLKTCEPRPNPELATDGSGGDPDCAPIVITAASDFRRRHNVGRPAEGTGR